VQAQERQLGGDGLLMGVQERGVVSAGQVHQPWRAPGQSAQPV
jgi:hypothetical protein